MSDTNTETRARKAAELAAAAVRAGQAITIAPLTDLDALARTIPGFAAKPNAPNTKAPATVARNDANGFLANLEKVASGEVKVK